MEVLGNPDQVPALGKPASIQSTPAHDIANVDPQEAGVLALKMAETYKAFVEHYRKAYGVEVGEAVARVDSLILQHGELSEQYEERIRSGPAREMSWHSLTDLARNDPGAGQARWLYVKREALDELESGHRAAEAVEGSYHSSPWERARFIALRYSLIAQWEPTNGIEMMLIDTLAQAHTAYMTWLSTLSTYTSLELEDQHDKYDKNGYMLPPRVSKERAIEQAMNMVDRWNRLFLRTLRQLRDLRRYSAPVNIRSAGQVNIGGQQINVAELHD